MQMAPPSVKEVIQNLPRLQGREVIVKVYGGIWGRLDIY